MSTMEYNKKLEEGKKLIISIKKDLKHREDQQKRGDATYQVDSEIKGSLNQLDGMVASLEKMLNNFKSNPKDFGLGNKDIEKRDQQYDQIAKERVGIKRQFDSFFQKKSTNPIAQMGSAPTNKQDMNKMSQKQLWDHKQKQEKQQEENLDDLIQIVKNTKQGGKNISKQLKEHQGLIDELGKGIDQNSEKMGKVRRKMMKLLEESSFCCLVVVIILELIAMILILVLWKTN